MTPSQTIKARYNKSDKTMTLKQFARSLAKGDGADVVKTWFANKNGVLERISKNERLKNKGNELAQIRNTMRANRAAKASKKK